MRPRTDREKLRESEADGDWDYEQYDPEDDYEWLYDDEQYDYLGFKERFSKEREGRTNPPTNI